VTSGYNNGTDAGGSGGDGRGYLFVLNAATGALIRAIPTTIGTASDPSGLGPLSAWAENAEFDATVSYVYGGDLKGNIWRFDLTDPTDPLNWSVTRLAELRDTAGNLQPVMTEPELARVGTNRYLYVGTGRYLGQQDIPGSPTATPSALYRHSMYGLIDDLSPTLIQRSSGLLTVHTATRTGTGNGSSVALSSGTPGTRGWVIDLPQDGERVDTSAQLVLGALTFVSNVPSGVDPCEPQGNSYFWQVDYRTGTSISGTTLGLSRWIQAGSVTVGGTPQPYSSISSRPVGVQVAQGYRSYINPTDGGPVVMNVTPPLGNAPGKRKSWRELGR
jgi:type IV pilus assembly protein PilY1